MEVVLSKWRRWSYQNGDGGTQLKEARARQNGWISGKTPKGLSGSGFPWVLAFWKWLFSWCKSIVVMMKVLMMLEIVVCTIARVGIVHVACGLLDLYCSWFHLCDHSQPQNIRVFLQKHADCRPKSLQSRNPSPKICLPIITDFPEDTSILNQGETTLDIKYVFIT